VRSWLNRQKTIVFFKIRRVNIFLATRASPKKISTAYSASVPYMRWESAAAEISLIQKRAGRAAKIAPFHIGGSIMIP